MNYFKEFGIALVKVLKEMIGFIKYVSQDLEKEKKNWKDYFKED